MCTALLGEVPCPMGIGECDLGAFNTGTAGKVERGMSILA
jgi:hypothetical protein